MKFFQTKMCVFKKKKVNIMNLTEDVNNSDRIYDSLDAPLPSEFLVFRLLRCLLENVMFSRGQINQTLV